MGLKDPEKPRRIIQNSLGKPLQDISAGLTFSIYTGISYLEPLEMYRQIRDRADKLYGIALRISQVAATAMECIQEGSSNQDGTDGGAEETKQETQG